MFEEVTKKEGERMLALYLDTEKKIKKQLESAILKGNDTAHLKKVLAGVQAEIKRLDNHFVNFAQLRLPLMYKSNHKVVDAAVSSFDTEFDLQSSLGRPNTEAIKTLANNTYLSLNQVSKVMGRKTEDFIREIGLKQTRGIVFGSTSWQKAARDMRDELNAVGLTPKQKQKGLQKAQAEILKLEKKITKLKKTGGSKAEINKLRGLIARQRNKIKKGDFFTIRYKNGREYPASAYSKMVARTTSAEAFRSGTRERIKQWGYDLVFIAGVSQDPDSPCLPYQGKTLSLSGETEGYTALSDAVSNGLFHPNCIHREAFSKDNLKLINED